MTILFFLKPSTTAWLPAPHEMDKTVLLGKKKKRKRTKEELDELRLQRYVEREHEEAFLLLLLMEL